MGAPGRFVGRFAGLLELGLSPLSIIDTIGLSMHRHFST
jgi:hypothetical protein